MRLETQRLILREYTMDDFDALYEILSDPETMRYYPKPFDQEKVRYWIEWNLENYAVFGFGLWAVVLKDTGQLIGDCGITMQNIHGTIRPEIGYHIHKARQRQGYASEAAAARKDYIFRNTPFRTICSYMKSTNEGSWRTAMKNGMTLIEEFENPVDTITRVYAITREEWEQANQQHSYYFSIK